MKFSTSSNQFTFARDSVAQRYAAHLEGALTGAGDAAGGETNGLFCVVSQRELDQAAKAALASSAKALGYGRDGCFFVAIEAPGAAAGAGAAGAPAAAQAAQAALSPTQLFELVEGIDPLALVVADAQAAEALCAAYTYGKDVPELPAGKPARLLGRSVVTFNGFSELLNRDDTKQRAWALLKKLPKITAN